MSFKFFLNFEKLSINIIRDSLNQMTNTNVNSIGEIDNVILEKNMYYGTIASVFCVNLYESALNSILSNELNCTEEEIIKASFNTKLYLICKCYGLDYVYFKSLNEFRFVNELIKLRNDLVHFKNNELGYAGWLHIDMKLSMGKTKVPISEIFTMPYIKKYYDATLKFIELLCDKCGLKMSTDCEVFDCDGGSETFKFIMKYQSEK